MCCTNIFCLQHLSSELVPRRDAIVAYCKCYSQLDIQHPMWFRWVYLLFLNSLPKVATLCYSDSTFPRAFLRRPTFFSASYSVKTPLLAHTPNATVCLLVLQGKNLQPHHSSQNLQFSIVKCVFFHENCPFSAVIAQQKLYIE